MAHHTVQLTRDMRDIAPQKQNSDSLRLFLSGGLSGAVSRTLTSPLERIKLLYQVQAIAQASNPSAPLVYSSILQTADKIYREEGVRAFWRGNGTNVIRIFPYSAVQFSTNDACKRVFASKDGHLHVSQRLLAGACAGMSATLVTHPLDVVRLRLSLPQAGYTGIANAFLTISRVEGGAALLKGLKPALIGIAPYAALNFASYDLLKHAFFGADARTLTVHNLGLGAASGLLATSICFPLDTVRRQMQMRTCMYRGQADAMACIWRSEGLKGFYRGWAANALKVMPQNSIRFAAYEALRSLFEV